MAFCLQSSIQAEKRGVAEGFLHVPAAIFVPADGDVSHVGTSNLEKVSGPAWHVL